MEIFRRQRAGDADDIGTRRQVQRRDRACNVRIVMHHSHAKRPAQFGNPPANSTPPDHAKRRSAQLNPLRFRPSPRADGAVDLGQVPAQHQDQAEGHLRHRIGKRTGRVQHRHAQIHRRRAVDAVGAGAPFRDHLQPGQGCLQHRARDAIIARQPAINITHRRQTGGLIHELMHIGPDRIITHLAQGSIKTRALFQHHDVADQNAGQGGGSHGTYSFWHRMYGVL